MFYLRILIFVLGLVLTLTGAWQFLSDHTKGQVINWVVNWTNAAVLGSVKVLVSVEGDLASIAQQFVNAFNSNGNNIFSTMRQPFTDLTTSVINDATLALVQGGESTPDNAVATATAAMGEAYGFGMASAATTAFFEACLPEKLNVLNGAGPLLAKMAGFDEVAEAVRDPLYENAFGKSLDYHFKSIFKPELPDEADAVTWHSRRLLTDDQLRTVFKYSGLKAEYEEPYVQSAYRAIQPRALATLFADTPFPFNDMRKALEFAGLRPQDVELMLPALQWSSLKNVRQEYVTALTRSAELGTTSDAELRQELDILGYSSEAIDLIMLTVATRKLTQLAELYRKSISEAYKYSLITDADYVPALEAIGIAAADANAHYAVDSEAKLGKEAAAAARAAARLAAETTRAAAKAALVNYAENNIDEIALAAALAVAGLPAQIIPFAVDVATLRRQASQRNVFGKLVNPRDAILLREQVAALKEQVIKKLLDTTTARAQLEGLGLPNVNIEDLLASWAAQALKTVLPVQ